MTMGATNLESGTTLDDETMKDLPVVAVIKTARFPKLTFFSFTYKGEKTDENQTLPAGLGDAGYEPISRQFAEGDTREFETTEERAATTCDQAAVRQTNWACVTGKLAEANVIFFCFELCTEFSPLRYSSAFAFISFKP